MKALNKCHPERERGVWRRGGRVNAGSWRRPSARFLSRCSALLAVAVRARAGGYVHRTDRLEESRVGLRGVVAQVRMRLAEDDDAAGVAMIAEELERLDAAIRPEIETRVR